MVWHIAVVLAILTTGCDLYLRVRAARRQRAQRGTDDLTRLENRLAFYELASKGAKGASKAAGAGITESAPGVESASHIH